MKVPTRRWRNVYTLEDLSVADNASMKVPTRRRGNLRGAEQQKKLVEPQ